MSSEKSPLLLHGSVQNYDQVEDTRPPSLKIMYLTVFISSLGFSVVLPTLWFYLNLELGGDKQFLGWVVAVYSLGQFVGSLVFGAWSQRRRTVEPLIVSLLISVAANVYYAMAEDIPPYTSVRKWHLIGSRFLVGFGAGNVSLCRAFVSEATTQEQRGQAMTITGAAQGVGFVLGPALGFALTFVPSLHGGPFTLDQYTAAGFASAFLILINICILPWTFHDIPGKAQRVASRKSRKCRGMWSSSGEQLAASVCIWIFFVILTGFSIFETITGPLTEFYLDFGDKKNGLLILGAGVLSLFVFIALGIVAKKTAVGDRTFIMFGLIVLTLSFLAINPWHGLPLAQLIGAAAGIGVGYPVASTVTYSLFSKVIAQKDQGDKMGLLTAAGSLARMLGPIWATALYDATGSVVISSNYTAVPTGLPTGGQPGFALFPVVAGLHALTAVLLAIVWKKLVPVEDAEVVTPTVN